MISPQMVSYPHAVFLYVALIKLTDFLMVLGVWHLVWQFRFLSGFFPTPKGIPDPALYNRVSIPLAMVFFAIFHIVGVYRRERIPWGFRPLKKIITGSVVSMLVFISLLYFADQAHFSRLYLMVFPLTAATSLVISRTFLHLAWQQALKSWVRPIRTLIVGSGDLLSTYIKRIKGRSPYPVTWIGSLSGQGLTVPGIAYLGTEEDLVATLSAQKIDRVIVSFGAGEEPRYEPILRSLSDQLVDVKVLPDFGKHSTFRYGAESECGIPFLHFNQMPMGTSDRMMKRLLDILISSFVLIFFSPLYLLIAILIKLESKGPVIYAQTRMGADGRIFQCYKFRSMSTDAEASTGAVWAVADDPRTTPIGSRLRRTSLDEIPQFLNVLMGNMSLVGPRPERPIFVDRFRKEVPQYMLRHKMKSGITGWAQINGWRGNTSIDERIKYDLYYIGHWSHLFDIKILVMTLWKGFINRHAY